MKILIHGGHVIDPANHVDGKLNLLTEDGKILWAGTGLPEADRYIDATGKIVTPGFIDIHMHEDPVEDGKLQQARTAHHIPAEALLGKLPLQGGGNGKQDLPPVF